MAELASLHPVSKHIIISFKIPHKNIECGNVNYSFHYIQLLRYSPPHSIVKSYLEKILNNQLSKNSLK